MCKLYKLLHWSPPSVYSMPLLLLPTSLCIQYAITSVAHLPLYTVCHYFCCPPPSVYSMSLLLLPTSLCIQYAITSVAHLPLYTVCHYFCCPPPSVYSMPLLLLPTSLCIQYAVLMLLTSQLILVFYIVSIYIYIYIYIYTYIHTHTYICIYIYMCVCVYISEQRCQLVRFSRKPYGFLRSARAYGRMIQSLRIFMILLKQIFFAISIKYF